MKLSEIKTNELEIKSYDVRKRCGRGFITDWVTEYTYISEQNLSEQEFDKVLEGQGAYGNITYKKFIMNFGNGQKLYKHVCKAIMY